MCDDRITCALYGSRW